MTQRFGRNQRRRAREALAQQQAETDRAMALARDHQEAGRRMQNKAFDLMEEIRAAKAMCARHSALFTPEIVKQYGLNTGRIEMAGVEVVPVPAGPIPVNEVLGAAFERMQLATVLMRTQVDLRDSAVHCHVQFGNRSVAYAANDDAVRSMPPARLQRMLADDIARELAQQLVNRGLW